MTKLGIESLESRNMATGDVNCVIYPPPAPPPQIIVIVPITPVTPIQLRINDCGQMVVHFDPISFPTKPLPPPPVTGPNLPVPPPPATNQ